MALKCHLAFSPVPRWATQSFASEPLEEPTPSTSISALASQAPSASEPPLVAISLAHTPPIEEAPPTSMSHDPNESRFLLCQLFIYLFFI